MNPPFKHLSRIMISITIFTALQSHAQEPQVTMNDQTKYASYDTAFVEGTMNPELLSLMKNHLNQAIARRPLVIFWKAEEGGSLDITGEMTKTYQQLGRAHQLRFGVPLTLVLNESCASACTVVAAALNKFAKPRHLRVMTANDTEFFFHGPSVYTEEDGINQINDPEEFRRRLGELYRAYLYNGVSGPWLVKNRRSFHQSKSVTYTAENLCRNHASGFLRQDSCFESNEAIFVEIEKIYANAGFAKAFLSNLMQIFQQN